MMLSLSLVKTFFLIVFAMILTLEAFDSHRIPVLKLHSVSNNSNWIGNSSISIPVNSFKWQIKLLNIFGYKTVFLNELHNLRAEKKKTNNIIALTFDDGYLDNWVNVYPILKESGHKATIYVSAQWIDSSENSGDKGYLNINKLKILQNSGVIDIQSHAVTHDRIFKNETITHFVHPHAPYKKPFKDVFLKNNPQKKINWFNEKMTLPMGFPIFSLGESLEVKEFIPDSKLIDGLTALASENKFFENNDWFTRLEEKAKSYKSLGIYETEEEQKKRYITELSDSKKILENILQKQVSHLAWPRTKWCKESETLALANGYLTTTAFSGDHNSYKNLHQLERVAISPLGNTFLDTLSFILEIQVFNGHYFFWPVLWVLHRFAKSYNKGSST